MEVLWHRGSSPVDWCEFNYRYSPVIAEFVNTISNILFILFPPLMFKLFNQYARTINRGVYIIWILFAIVGISSAYFHATLSLLGQLLDELSILWLIAAAFGMWTPRRHYPKWLKGNRKQFQYLTFAFSIFGTITAWIYPWINAFILMCFGIPVLTLMTSELRVCRVARVKRVGLRCGLCCLFAIGCWISDRIFCDLWSAVNFPYLHGAWHILISISSYTMCVIFAYFDALYEHPETMPVLKFWPNDHFELGVPYVALKNAD